jgi:hypothetical protein
MEHLALQSFLPASAYSLGPPRISNTNSRARESAPDPSGAVSCDLRGPGFRAASMHVGQSVPRVGVGPPGPTSLAAGAATRTAGAACMSAGRARGGKGRSRGARAGRLASRASSAVSTLHLRRAPGSGHGCTLAGHTRLPLRAGGEEAPVGCVHARQQSPCPKLGVLVHARACVLMSVPAVPRRRKSFASVDLQRRGRAKPHRGSSSRSSVELAPRLLAALLPCAGGHQPRHRACARRGRAACAPRPPPQAVRCSRT